MGAGTQAFGSGASSKARPSVLALRAIAARLGPYHRATGDVLALARELTEAQGAGHAASARGCTTHDQVGAERVGPAFRGGLLG